MKIPGDDQGFPLDLVSVLLVTLLAVVLTVTQPLSNSLARIPIGIVFLFFVPGYVLTAVLFPQSSQPTEPDDDGYLGPVDRNFTALERTAVSIGLSIAVVVLLVLVIDASPWLLSVESILVSVGGFVVVATGLAAHRRRRLPPEDRLQVFSRSHLKSVRSAVWGPNADRLTNVLLIISVVLLSLSVAYVATVPREDQRFTRFYVLSENGGGELTTDSYPVDLAVDESGQVVVAIENHEHEQLSYSAVVLLQRIDRDGDAVAVVSEERLTSFDTELSHGETERQRVRFSPSVPDEELRVSFLLFRGSVPADPSPDDSYRHLHLLVNRDEGTTPASS